ncbi:MAG: HD domain-containing protein [Gammaproteobacteria bacterium]
MINVIDEIDRLFANQGQRLYYGEAVSEQEHALQAAYRAEQAGEPAALVISALLHDIGHLLHGLGEDIAERGIDGRHEYAGASWLAQHFAPEVSEPVRLHVAAKRYLCAVDPAYHAALSPASQLSLQRKAALPLRETSRRSRTSPITARPSKRGATTTAPKW